VPGSKKHSAQNKINHASNNLVPFLEEPANQQPFPKAPNKIQGAQIEHFDNKADQTS
jgi:hypothetical protein